MSTIDVRQRTRREAGKKESGKGILGCSVVVYDESSLLRAYGEYLLADRPPHTRGQIPAYKGGSGCEGHSWGMGHRPWGMGRA